MQKIQVQFSLEAILCFFLVFNPLEYIKAAISQKSIKMYLKDCSGEVSAKNKIHFLRGFQSLCTLKSYGLARGSIIPSHVFDAESLLIDKGFKIYWKVPAAWVHLRCISEHNCLGTGLNCALKINFTYSPTLINIAPILA